MPFSSVTPELVQKAQMVEWLILDVDGVLTDGRIYFTSDGRELKAFDARDGHGIRLALRAGLKLAIISGRIFGGVLARAKELGISEVHQGVHNKLEAYQQLRLKYGMDDAIYAYVGDDVVDIPLMRRVGLAVAVADAAEEVQAVADYVTKLAGGRGAVREVIELILKAQGKWAELMRRYIEG